MKKLLLFAAAALLSIPSFAQTAIIATKVTDSNYAPVTGSICIGASCNTLTAGVATGTPTVPNPTTGSLTILSGSTTILTIPGVTASGSVFNYDIYVVPANASITGVGMPRIACYPGAIYTQTDGGQTVWHCVSNVGLGIWQNNSGPVPAPSTFPSSGTGPVVNINLNYSRLANATDLGGPTYAVDTGTANAYVATLNPPIVSYAIGTHATVKIAHTSTGASTLNLGLGPITIQKKTPSGLAAIAAGDLVATQPYTFDYDPALNVFTTSVTTSGGGATLPSSGIVNATSTTTGVAASAANLSSPTHATTTGSANTYAAALSPALTAYTANYSAVTLTINVTNTGASTLNLNGLGALPINKKSGSGLVAVVAGDLVANQPYTFECNTSVCITSGSTSAGGGIGGGGTTGTLGQFTGSTNVGDSPVLVQSVAGVNSVNTPNFATSVLPEYNVLSNTATVPNDNVTDNSAVFNFGFTQTAYGAARNVYVPNAGYHVTHATTLPNIQTQNFHGDGIGTQLNVSTDFDPTAAGVITIGATNNKADIQPGISDMMVTFAQPNDCTTHLTVAANIGDTTLTVASTACINSSTTYPDYAVDSTNDMAWPIADNNDPLWSTTATVIDSTHVQLSNPVAIAIPTTDQLNFSVQKALWTTLAQGCSLTAGAPGCKYPPAIYNNGAQSLYIHRFWTEGAWNCIYQRGQTYYILESSCGSFNIGIDQDGSANFSSVGNFQLYDQGLGRQGTKNFPNVALKENYYNYDLSTVHSFTLTGATFAGGVTSYAGTITGGASNALKGLLVTIAGYTNSGNNGTFTITASSATSITTSNTRGTTETAASTANTPAMATTCYMFGQNDGSAHGAIGCWQGQGILRDTFSFGSIQNLSHDGSRSYFSSYFSNGFANIGIMYSSKGLNPDTLPAINCMANGPVTWNSLTIDSKNTNATVMGMVVGSSGNCKVLGGRFFPHAGQTFVRVNSGKAVFRNVEFQINGTCTQSTDPAFFVQTGGSLDVDSTNYFSNACTGAHAATYATDNALNRFTPVLDNAWVGPTPPGPLGNYGSGGFQVVRSCSTSGTVTFTEPRTMMYDKQVLAVYNNCLGTATAYTFPVAFANVNSVMASSTVAASNLTVTLTTATSNVTGSAVTGTLLVTGN